MLGNHQEESKEWGLPFHPILADHLLGIPFQPHERLSEFILKDLERSRVLRGNVDTS